MLSDGKPSLLLNRLRNLNNNKCSDEVLKTIVLDQLPSHVRAILAMSNVDDLQALAELVDKVTEAAGPSGFQILAIAQDTSHDTPSVMATTSSGKLEAIERQVAQRTKQMSQLLDRNKVSNTRFPRAKSRSNSRDTKRRDRSFNRKHDGVCYYHHKFGVKADRCSKPCSWKQSSESGN